ncbi:MAG: TonB-dependent receptor [Lentimicrobium sp.]|jgi:TonB-linked SusC/RagA family outer membrane protein|nr:TonB-dependent receptor [Lentimicrobium sp.]
MTRRIISVTITDTCKLFFLSFAFIFLFPIAGIAQSKVSLRLENATMVEFFKAIEKKSSVRFSFINQDIDTQNDITVNAVDENVETLLDKVLTSKGYSYKRTGNTYAVVKNPSVKAASSKKITGLVTDEIGDPIVGASILIKGSNTGTITDINGIYVVEVENQSQLLISYIGYTQEQIKIGPATQYKTILKEDTRLLDEIVVVGYGSQRKVNMTGSVATISAADIASTQVSSTSSLLGGRLSGVITTNPNGFPGGGSTVSIRGASSWNNAPVLFIIDDVQVDKNAFDALNTEEIESISVLKDASAAVYGSRAANGVILVKTKRGTDGKPRFVFSSNVGIASLTDFPELLNANEYGELWNEAQRNMGFNPENPSDANKFLSPEVISAALIANNNWFNETFKNVTYNQRYNISVNGGSDRIKYFMSLGYLNNEGMYDNLNYSRFNLRTNIDAKVSDNISVRLDLQGYESVTNQPNIEANSLFELVTRRTPFQNIYNADGTYFDMGSRHPVAEVNETGYKLNTTNSYRGKLGFYYTVPFIKGLEASALFSYVKGADFSKSFLKPYSLFLLDNTGAVSNERRFNKTTLEEQMTNGNNFTINYSLNYARQFDKKHDVTGLLVYEQYEATNNVLGAFRTNFPFTSIDYMFAGAADLEQTIWTSPFQDGRRGVIGRFNYNYSGKYLFEYSFRYDGSVKFHPDRRWGYFPSYSAGWRISEEQFMKSIETLDNLKIRGSYGVLGNDAVGGWSWQTDYAFSSNYIFNQTEYKSVTSGGIPNTELTWEKTATMNAGLEFSFFKGLLSGEIDVFNKRTYDVLGSRNNSVPSTFGATLPTENYGEISAKGFELQLGHKHRIGNMNYRIAGNVSWARNEVKIRDFASGIEPWNNPIGKPLNYRLTHQALGIFSTDDEAAAWPRFTGTSPKAGDIKYADINNDGIIDSRDLQIVTPFGNTPEIMFGLNFSANWKGFDASVLFQGAANRNVMLSGFATQMFVNGDSNLPKYLYEDRWTPENLNARFPKAWIGENTVNTRNSTLWLFNGNYVRLKNLEIGYTTPKSISKILGIQALRIYAGGTNLLSFSALKGYDPEKGDGGLNYYPQQRVINLGLNLTF